MSDEKAFAVTAAVATAAAAMEWNHTFKLNSLFG